MEYYSFPFGALSLKQTFIAGNIPTQEELRRLSFYIAEQFQSLPWLCNKKVPIVAFAEFAVCARAFRE
jgi:exopolyphosphatase/guanosine-5'-triphosphate,3'-diphosphate pyrophosphatase